MTIKGLTDRGLAFAQIGDIRKGAAKQEGVNRPGGDLKWFRVEFDAREVETEKQFRQLYGQQPTDIDIVLPFDDIDRCWDAWCEAYTAGRMVARSDGEYFVYLSDVATGAVKVQNGFDANGAKVPHQDIIGKAGKTDVKCRPVGRLKVIVPGLRRAAYLVVHTTSVIDIRNISEQLRAIQAMNGGRIAGVPLVLRRRPKMVSCPTSEPGKKARREKWMLSIEADPKWVAAMLTAMDTAALPAGAERPALPAVPEEADEDFDGEWDEIDGDAPEGEPVAETVDEYSEVEPDTTPAMTLEEAEAMTNSRGDKYGDMDIPTLEKVKANIFKAMSDPAIDADYYAELGKKHTAIVMILASKKAE